MKYSRNTLYWLVILIGITSLTNCRKQMESYEEDKERQKVEKATPVFDPTYFKDPVRKHLALFFEVVDGELFLSDRPVQVRPGRMPYYSKMKKAGGVLIVFSDVEGKELGRYTIEDPTFLRSCDLDYDSINVLQPIQQGTIEVLLPYDINIATVEIGKIEEKPTSFDVVRQIKEVIKQ